MASTSAKNGPVTTRMVGPSPDEDGDLTKLLRAAPQIEGEIPFKITFEKITPADAKKFLEKAHSASDFDQRKMMPADLERWEDLMHTNRFVHYLPNGPLCFDGEGVLLNGMHRMTALANLDGRVAWVGMMVMRDVPRFMFRYFDTGRTRSLNHVFQVRGKHYKAQTGSALRAAMRYEEYLYGLRKPSGWREWGSTRDEHSDVDWFFDRRPAIGDHYQEAQRAYNTSKIVVAAGMVFRFYQSLAWPEGADTLEEFWDGLISGKMTSKPVLELRDWGRDHGKERINGKRELHVMLLNRYFDMHVRKAHGAGYVNWVYGMPMLPPYHPKGSEVAIENVKDALAELDKLAAEATETSGTWAVA